MGKLTSWLLKETKGVTLLDKSMLFSLKIIYLALRVSIRIVLGKQRTNRLYRLTIIIDLNYAAYSKQTKLKRYLSVKGSGFSIYNTIMVNRAKPEEKFIEVNANTLDYLLQQNGIRDANWIKIDVEGAEFE